jgi:hypothetical protein
MEFYGTGNADPGTRPMERKGAMSNYDLAEIAQTKNGDIEFNEDSIKLHLPIFTILTIDEPYTQGNRFQLKHTKDTPKASWHNRVVCCIGSVKTELGKINKEVAMFECGSVSKARTMQCLNEKLGEDIGGETEVFINFIGNAFFLRDIAQGNEQFRAGELVDLEEIGSRVVRPNMMKLAVEDDNGEE